MEVPNTSVFTTWPLTSSTLGRICRAQVHAPSGQLPLAVEAMAVSVVSETLAERPRLMTSFTLRPASPPTSQVNETAYCSEIPTAAKALAFAFQPLGTERPAFAARDAETSIERRTVDDLLAVNEIMGGRWWWWTICHRLW